MKFLLGTDDSPHAQAAVALLKRLPLPSNRDLTLLSVIGRVPPVSYGKAFLHDETGAVLRRLQNSLRQDADAMLARQAMRCEAPGWSVQTMIREGHVAGQFVAVAEVLGVDLVAVGSKGPSDTKRFLLGRVSDQVVRHAPCSVLVSRLLGEANTKAACTQARQPAEEGSRCRFLVGYDGSPSAPGCWGYPGLMAAGAAD
ncbi:hypothetical protein NKDENANG_02004 [Candidatus Entotheonellaceae bacterium PAL068K]